MNCEKENEIIGIQLITGGRIGTKTCLGVILIPSKQGVTLDNLRTVLYCQVTTLPENFTFCSTQGWKINRNLESSIHLNQIITDDCSVYIQRHFDKPHVGISEKSGEKMGMIFVDLKASLTEARQCINLQMTGSKLTKYYYWFLTHNGWPISSEQESQLTVIDLLEDSCLTVDMQTFLTPTTSPLSPSPQPRKKIKGTRHLSFCTSKDLDRKQIADSSMTEEKQILISYVRAEAAHHALSMKQELSSLGFSVYLDVHEIKSGADWQDSLNDAVRNCQVFVPLVTPKYGETLWTNREVKLADVLGKYIIPVTFLVDWPPPCLAIQFSTTQYVNWRHPKHSDETKDISIWDTRDLKYVAQQIAEKVQKFMDTDFSSLMKRKTVVKSCPCVGVSNPQATVENREGHPLVVICVHPQQSALGEEIKVWLENHGFEVWCSTQLSMNYPDSLTDLNNGLKPGTVEIQNRQIFQEQADEAGIIIVVLSEQFSKSRTCQQQVFYCEQRKKLVPLLCGDFVIPGWLTVLTRHHVLMNTDVYRVQLLKRLQKLLASTHFDKEALMASNVSLLKNAVTDKLSVYVVGSTICNGVNTEQICRLIGKQLASLRSVVFINGGKIGVEDMALQSFYQETQKSQNTNEVVHILPQKEVAEKSYGQVVHIDGSAEDFMAVISKVFDILIIIGGDSEQSRLCKNFLWNEKTVIPVLCTKEEGSCLVSEKPQDITENDWLTLTDSIATPEQIGKSVKNVILQNSCDKLPYETDHGNVTTKNSSTSLRKMTTVLLPEKT